MSKNFKHVLLVTEDVKGLIINVHSEILSHWKGVLQVTLLVHANSVWGPVLDVST